MRRPGKNILQRQTSGRRLDTRASVKVFQRGSQVSGGSDASAIHDGDAAGGDLAGTYPNPTVPGLASAGAGFLKVTKWGAGD